MADNDWLKLLVEKLDQDRRASEERSEQRMQRIEHLIERQVDQMEAVRKEIKDDLSRQVDQMEALRKEIKEGAKAGKWFNITSLATLVGLMIGFAAFLLALWQFLRDILPSVITG